MLNKTNYYDYNILMVSGKRTAIFKRLPISLKLKTNIENTLININ